MSTIKVKPSVSFTTLGRDQIKMNHFVDLDNGPNPIQARENVKTLRETRKGSLFYDQERYKHSSTQEQSVQALKEA